ncbi:hypothetical protein ACN4EE_07175 [Geminocystis sp. CENA526]|uniref:hypothetical protein n=1 Tax=Geminocystis sp. CENA526 TaxID=1355871 RepID=UPI003D6DB0CB
MLKKTIICLLLILFLSIVPIPQAQGGHLSLFSSLEWNQEQTNFTKNPQNFSQEIQNRLNSTRDSVGQLALLISHPYGTYDYTRPIFVAPRDGGGIIFEVDIHWHRNLKLISRNHVTRIAWEIINNKHYKASVIWDDSTFNPTHSEEINDFFRQLLPS